MMDVILTILTFFIIVSMTYRKVPYEEVVKVLGAMQSVGEIRFHWQLMATKMVRRFITVKQEDEQVKVSWEVPNSW